MPSSARSPAIKQSSAAGALAFIAAIASSNQGAQAASRKWRSFTATKVKSRAAVELPALRRPGHRPSVNKVPALRRSNFLRVSSPAIPILQRILEAEQVLQKASVQNALAASCFAGTAVDSQEGKKLQKILFQIGLGAILGFDRLDFIQEQADVAADTLDVNFRREFKV